MSEGTTTLIGFCGSFALLIAGVIVVAVVVKLREIRRAKRWPSTAGRVIASRVQSRRKQPGDAGYDFHDTEVTNEPFVEYEYAVGGRTYSCSRVTIGDMTSASELGTILGRYPVGTAVTVYYDPADPSKAVLERDLPKGTLWAIGCVLALVVGAPVVVVLVYSGVLGWLESHLANPGTAPFVAAAGGFGLVALLMAVGMCGYVLRASRWPTTRGRIIAAGEEKFRARFSEESRVYWRTMYKPSVLYTYEVNGRQYQGDRLRLGVVASATFPWAARRTAARYPVGREVTVYYDPDSPGESVLRPWSWFHLIPPLVAAGVLALAWAVATGRV